MDKELSGLHSAKVDERGRTAIPARLLEVFRSIASARGEEVPAEGMEVVVGLDLQMKVAIFPKSVHREFLDFLQSRPKFDPYWQKVMSTMTSVKEVVQLDKQNRIKIPSLLIEEFDVKNDVVMAGAVDHIQVMSKADWVKSLRECEASLEQIARRQVEQG